jgi:hypothetical protein
MYRTALCAALGVALSLFASHKTVWAAPMISVSAETGVAVIQLPSGDQFAVTVPARFFVEPDKQPAAGDYLVVYQPDGYMSWSPKDVFEAGYSAVPDEPGTVTAKLRCHHISDNGSSRTVHLSPVYSSDPASPNYSWSQATPSGQFTMSITNPAAYERFVENGEYMVTFSPVG